MSISKNRMEIDRIMNFKEYFERNYKLFLVQMSAPALGLIAFVVYIAITDQANHNYPYAITISLGITLIANIAGTAHLFSELKNENIAVTQKAIQVVNDNVNTVKTAISEEASNFRQWQSELESSKFKIEVVSAEEFNSKVDASFLKHNQISNTYVNLCKLTGLNTQQGLEVLGSYQKFLSKPSNHWIDVCGVEDYLNGRFNDIDLADNVSGKHELYIISDSLPIINFTILGNNGTPSEVYFGWLMNDVSNGEVYHSSDQRILDLFSRYFELLIRRKKDYSLIDYSLAKSRRFENLTIDVIRGTWISVSTSNSSKLASGYSKYSIIQIYVVDGNWMVRGQVIQRSNGKIIHVIKGVSASIFEDGIFYRFERTNYSGHSVVKGHGTYQLSASDKSVATGVYVTLSDKKHPIHNLRAIKISEEIGVETPTIDKQEADIYIEQIQESINLSV